MRLDELNPEKIILDVLGDRETLKPEEELLQIFKARFTKKERVVLKEKSSCIEDKEICSNLNVDEKRLEEIYSAAVKKIKNQSVHKEFYL